MVPWDVPTRSWQANVDLSPEFDAPDKKSLARTLHNRSTPKPRSPADRSSAPSICMSAPSELVRARGRARTLPRCCLTRSYRIPIDNNRRVFSLAYLLSSIASHRWPRASPPSMNSSSTPLSASRIVICAARLHPTSMFSRLGEDASSTPARPLEIRM